MAGQNTQIIASDYNTIQSKIALVLGSGSGTTGYGQTVSSSQVGQFSKITVTQWNNLRNDILRARQHQTGTDLSASLTTPTASVKITETDRAAYLTMATDAETNRITAPPPASQATRSDLVAQQVRNTQWNGRISQAVVVTWGSVDDARYFWNTGGQIEFSSARSGGSAGNKNVSWTTMLASMGTIIFNINGTTHTGSSASYTMADGGLGFYNLTTSDNAIFEIDTKNTDTYFPNKYYIYARVNDTVNRTQLIFTITWADDSVPPVSRPDPGFQVDENVDGTLISTVQCYRATGTNVSVAVPPASTSAIA